MRIDELQPSMRKEFSTASRRSISDKLEDAGYRLLGKGSSGSVFEIPGKPDKVLKIFREDSGFAWWVDYCRANAGKNPWLPRFRSAVTKISTHTSKSVTTDIYGVMIERLTSNTRDEIGYVINMMVYQSVDKRFIEEEDYWMVSDPNLIQIAFDLRRFADSLDMRRENIMMRGDQIVIADPLAE